MSPFLPAEPAEVAECVIEAAANRTPLSITGLGSKAALGRPMKNGGRLDLSRLDGVTFYESGALVFSALAGTPHRDQRDDAPQKRARAGLRADVLCGALWHRERNDRRLDHGQSLRPAPDQGGRGAGFCLGGK